MKHMPMETDDAYVFGLRRAPSAVHNARAWSVHERLKGALAAAAGGARQQAEQPGVPDSARAAEAAGGGGGELRVRGLGG